MKRKLRLTKRQGIIWSISLVAVAIGLFEMAEHLFGIRWAEMGKEQLGMLCFTLGGLFLSYAIWLMIKHNLRLGEPYNTMRSVLEVLREELQRVEESGDYDEAGFRQRVVRFNESAKALRIKEYGR